MENNNRVYNNRAGLTGAERGLAGSYKVLKLRFAAWNAEKKIQEALWYTMFLTEENNDRNREVLQHLGVESPPEIISYETVPELKGLGTRTVDLVSEINEAGYSNVKYVNEPKFGQRVFDMTEK